MLKNFIVTTILGGVLLASPAAFADSAKDLAIISKAISFMNGAPKGNVDMAVIYDPSNSDSVAHADQIVELSAGQTRGAVKLAGKKVPVSDINSISAPILFLTRAANSGYDTALARAKSIGGVTVSTDTACLDNSACVLVVKSKPNVDIFVSSAASKVTGTSFAAAFSMMITKK